MTLKEKIKKCEQDHPKFLHYLGIGSVILFGILLILTLLFVFKDKLAVDYASATNTLSQVKFWLIVIGILAFIGILVKNIITGEFNLTKFVGGFNIFSGPVQGKLIYYGVIFSIVAAVSLGIYHKLTQTTYAANYKNQIKAEQVVVDQKVIYPTPEDNLFLGIKIFGLKLGITIQSRPKPVITENNAVKENGKKSIQNNTTTGETKKK